MTLTFVINDASDMADAAKVVARQLQSGDFIVLTGPLGAGKTTFTLGLGQELGVKTPVTSPTFVVSRQHKPSNDGLGLIHVDAYRLSNSEDLIDLDLDMLTSQVAVIEWGAPFIQAISDDWLEIEIAREDLDHLEADQGSRRLTMHASGKRWESAIGEIEMQLAKQFEVITP